MKRWWVVALILLITSGGDLVTPAWSAPPSQQPPGLGMEVEAAFDGYFKYGEWLPIWVELENAGPDLETELRVRVPGRLGGASATTFAAAAPLPTGSRKRIPVYVLPNNFSHALEVQLVAGDEVLHSQEVPVNAQPNVNYLVGLVAPERGALSFIAGVPLPGQERPKTLIDLSPADLPERAEGLRSFDVLILNDVDTSSLTPGQKAALEAWVRQGGRLVIGGGVGAMSTASGMPDSLLPFVPRGVVEIDALPGLAEFTGSEAIRVPGPFVVASGDEGSGHTLAAQNGLPLVRERSVGGGTVDFITLDLAAVPFDAWAGTTVFWERLLSPDAAYPDWLPRDISARQMNAGQMTYALSRLPALELPSIRGLGLLLALYVVLVGPINYFVLRWRKRLHWAWITVPLITVTFSAGAFGLGYAFRGTDLILNKIAVIGLRSDDTAHVTSYLGLFSPARQSYEIEVSGGSLLSPLNPDYNPWGSGAVSPGGELVFVQGEPGQVRGLNVNQWSMQTFMTEGMRADVGHIEGDLQVEDDVLVGTLRNETAYRLTDTVLVLGNRFVRLGNLGPGEATSVRMDGLDFSDRGFSEPLSYQLFQDQLMQPGIGGPPPEAELKRLVVEYVFDQGSGVGPMSSGIRPGGGWGSPRGLTFLGWLDNAPPNVRVAGRTPTQQTTALLYAPISYHLSETGDISLPPGFIPGTVVEMPEAGGMCGPNQSSIWLERGNAVFEFYAPEEIQDLQVDKLKLVIGTDGGGWWEPPDAAVYAWDTGAWLSIIDPLVGVNVIPDASGLVSEDGQIRIRLSSESNRGGCLHLAMGLEGTR